MSTVRLMSHNVWGMFGPDTVKRVDNRSDLMRKIYCEYLPDVIGMQEYSADIEESGLLQSISSEYSAVNISENIAKLEMKWCYTPVLYRNKTLELKKKGFILFDRNYNNHDSKGISYAVFLHKESGKIFTVANTHFWWKNLGPEHENARVVNAKEIIDLCNRLPHPFFVMGDMNCNCLSTAYKTLIDGGFDDLQNSAIETVNISTHHKYPEYDFEKMAFVKGFMPLTKYENSIDHILQYNQESVPVTAFKVITDPDALLTSDHCPLFSDIVL